MREWFISLCITLFFLPSDIYSAVKMRWFTCNEYLVELDEPENGDEDE